MRLLMVQLLGFSRFAVAHADAAHTLAGAGRGGDFSKKTLDVQMSGKRAENEADEERLMILFE